jgi:uncharacterized membrane protein
MTETDARTRPLPLAITLIVTGILGWYSAFALTIDKIRVLEDPLADLDCNFSLIVQCGANLQSAQGAIFGFPNPLLGLSGFVAPIAVGVAILAGAKFARWFWIALNIGVAGAIGFCIWLISQSIFLLGTLCPWCMLVWASTIVMFWTLTLFNARAGILGAPLVRVGAALYPFVPLLVFSSYLVIVILAQVRLDLLSYLTL